ncbi:T9SS type A sorting domain-containing protein [bacterium]|nr:T9SS type A sorting domain-containing protein [bacterium]
MKAVLSLVLVSCFALLAAAQEPHLSPLDFGFGLLDHGMVDYCNPPPNTKAGHFNSDDYLDIARFDGSRLEIFISTSYGYTPEPQQSKTFDKPIASLSIGGTVWDTHPPLKVVFTDGTEELFCLRRGMLDLDSESHPTSSSRPRRTISEADFEIVWESQEYSEKMNKCTVGDLDGDGVMELISSWRENNSADSVYIVIYKNSGDDTYELYMEVLFDDAIYGGSDVGVSFFLITDIDQNGQRELLFTFDGCYFLEFSAPGVYTEYRSDFIFPRGVKDVKLSDFDRDSTLELSFVMNNSDFTPPTAYYVCEFDTKDTVNFIMDLDIVTGFWQDWGESRLAVGDFDGDGADDIVPGRFSLIFSWSILDVPFYRYNPASSTDFDLHWLETGLPISCATPIVEDIDCDGDLDLFASGNKYGGAGSFIWEGTGLLTGYVSWIDTVNTLITIDFSSYGCVDGAPAIVSSATPSVAPTTTSQLSLWRWEGDGFTFAWVSNYLYSFDYRTPHLADMDGDGKMSILIAEDNNNKLIDWEQTSTGIWESPENHQPDHFQLHSVYPNPFNATTIIPFELNEPGDVEMSVYDISGRLVYQMREDNLLPGYYEIDWHSEAEASGIYIFYLRSGDEVQIRKGVLLK